MLFLSFRQYNIKFELEEWSCLLMNRLFFFSYPLGIVERQQVRNFELWEQIKSLLLNPTSQTYEQHKGRRVPKKIKN